MKKRIIYRRTAFIVATALLVLLIAVQAIPLSFHESDLMSQSALQAMRAQKIAKDVLVLEYRPAAEHAQAISEIQNTLPVWESKQTYLQGIHNTDAQTLLNQAQPDYVSIDTAAKVLLANPSDATEAQIVLQHERNYSLYMSQLSTIIQDRIQTFNSALIAIQCSITVLVLITVVVLFWLSRPQKEVI